MRSRLPVLLMIGLLSLPAFADYTNNIMLTGYWPPTNEMMRSLSPNPEQNGGEWLGQNWEGRGYDVYAYFPEFPGGTQQNPRGEGDFEVDYQDTSADWWRITEEVQPVATITFGAAMPDYDWELEGGHMVWPPSYWHRDYLDPTRPTMDLPIMSETWGTVRYSSLPLAGIIDAVSDAVPHLNPYSTAEDDSNFLCNFIGYHANWYHDMHSDPNDPAWNVAAGHIHVGTAMTVDDATLATEATLRALIEHVDSIVPEPTGIALMLGVVAFARRRR